jgi:hypothetical protein
MIEEEAGLNSNSISDKVKESEKVLENLKNCLGLLEVFSYFFFFFRIYLGTYL